MLLYLVIFMDFKKYDKFVFVNGFWIFLININFVKIMIMYIYVYILGKSFNIFIRVYD